MSSSVGISRCSVGGCERVVDLYPENICGETEEGGCGGAFCLKHLCVGNADGPFAVALCVSCAPSPAKVVLGRVSV